AILSILAWVQVIKRLHLMKTWRLALLVVTVALIPLFFTQTLVASTLALVVLGFGYGGVTVTMDIVAARILDEDKARYGVQREGTFSSLTGVLNKTSGLFAAIGFFMVSRIYGYQNGEIPGPQPADAARFLISIFPFIIMVVCVLLSLLLKFKEDTTSGEVTTEALQ
ncbi:MAG: MFS transporter, partial [Anaerolineaceae bacterium]|nr:MFS transporter [Anaerolineaceae bacterium]